MVERVNITPPRRVLARLDAKPPQADPLRTALADGAERITGAFVYGSMTSALDALSGRGKPLRAEPFDSDEFGGLKHRPANRYIVYGVLPHTLGLGPEVWRVQRRAQYRRTPGE